MALAAASACGHEEVIQLLLEKGADVNAPTVYGYCEPLYAAIDNGHEGVVRLLLDNGADVNAGGGMWGNPLQVAVGLGCKNVV